jgi:hypothetical protein
MQINSPDYNQVKLYEGFYPNFIPVWKRASEITEFTNGYEGTNAIKPTLWGSKGINDNTSYQGNLGDCWWLASANAVAEYPELIKNLFVQDELSENGAMTVKLFVNGEWAHVTIDDYLPTFT